MGWRTKRWSSVIGVVTASSIMKQPGFFGKRRFSATVSYTFKAADVTYEGSRIFYGHDSLDSTYLERAALMRLQRYKPGTEVTVYYNPTKPRDAVLEPGINGHTYLYVLLSAGLLAAGVEAWSGP